MTQPVAVNLERDSLAVKERSASRHVLSLDGLRGLAVLGVVATHVFSFRSEGHGWLVWAVGQVCLFGARGVDLFFVLSGFLITGILFDSLADASYFRKFYARRSLRIFPLYYGTLLILFALTPVLHIEWHHENWALLFYLQNTPVATPIWDFHVPDGMMLVHFWSLAVEEQFYLVWPLVVFLVRDRVRLLMACGAISLGSLLIRLVFSLQHVAHDVVTKSTITRLDALLCGAALALLVRGPVRSVVMKSGRTMFLLASVALVAVTATRSDVLRDSLGLTLWALASGGLIAWCLVRGSAADRIFERPVLRWFGRYSYGIYLLHYIAVGHLQWLFRGWVEHVTTNHVAVAAISGVLLTLTASAAAYVSYHLFEKHFLKLKRYFEYRRPETIPTYRPAAPQDAGQLI